MMTQTDRQKKGQNDIHIHLQYIISRLARLIINIYLAYFQSFAMKINCSSSGGPRKKIFGGPGPSSFGRLSEITIEPINSTSNRTTVSKNWGGWARFGGPVPPGPNVEPPLCSSQHNHQRVKGMNQHKCIS